MGFFMDIKEIIVQLKELNEDVPNPLTLPKEQDVVRAEKDLGITFPNQYRHFLLYASDVVYGTLEPANLDIRDNRLYLINVAKEGWDAGIAKDLLPICQDNGDYYCLNKNGEVVYWSHNGFSNEKWSDLATWIHDVWIEG